MFVPMEIFPIQVSNFKNTRIMKNIVMRNNRQKHLCDLSAANIRKKVRSNEAQCCHSKFEYECPSYF